MDASEIFVFDGARYSPEEYGFVSVVSSRAHAEDCISNFFKPEGIAGFLDFSGHVQKHPIYPVLMFCAFGSAPYKYHAEYYLDANIESVRGFMRGVKSGFNSFLLPDGERLSEDEQLFFLRKTYEFSIKIRDYFDFRRNSSKDVFIPTWSDSSVFLIESIRSMFDVGCDFDKDQIFGARYAGKSYVLGRVLDEMPMGAIKVIEELGADIVR